MSGEHAEEKDLAALEGVDYEKLRSHDPEETERYFSAFLKFTREEDCHPGVILMIEQYFTNWALPICVKLMTALFEKYVSPETWEKTLQSMSGRRRTTHAGNSGAGFSD